MDNPRTLTSDTTIPPTVTRAIILLCGQDSADVADADLDAVCTFTSNLLHTRIAGRSSIKWDAAYEASPPALRLAMVYAHLRTLGG